MPVANKNLNSKELNYPFSQKLINCLLLPLVSFVSFALGSFALSYGHDIAGCFLVAFSFWFIFLSAFGFFMCSSITVNDEGIAASIFGRRLRSIRWLDVRKIKKVRRWNAGSRSYEDVFYIFDKDYSRLQERLVNLQGPIAFSDKILGLRGLLDAINIRSEQLHISLVVTDQEAARTIAAQKGLGSWSKEALKLGETTVSQF